jgi:hypothetical protein
MKSEDKIVYYLTPEQLELYHTCRQAREQFIEDNLGKCPKCGNKRERAEPMDLPEWFEIWVECLNCPGYRWRFKALEQEVEEIRREDMRKVREMAMTQE